VNEDDVLFMTIFGFIVLKYLHALLDWAYLREKIEVVSPRALSRKKGHFIAMFGFRGNVSNL
jgi:hypothetical protein